MVDTNANGAAVNEIYAFPTSYAQQRLWFLQRFEPDNPAYNIPAAFRLAGTVNVAALEKSFTEIVRRHDTLRTTFSLVAGEPKQIVAPAAPAAMSIVDLRSLPQSERESELRQRMVEEAKRSFDLESGSLFQVSLILIDDQESVLIINMHHIISDGWSIPILFREIALCYEAFSKNLTPVLPELPIQYADYAIWQREWLQGEILERQLSYWKKQLAGIPAVLNLPTDRPRPAVQSFRGKRQTIELSKELSDEIKALARQQGATLFMTLLAAFQALLHRYTGQEDIVVGSPIAGRNRMEIEGLIGFFVNTLVLRANFASEPTFLELLAQVKETALGAYTHQDLPFEKLVEELRPDRDLSRSPLFQAMFVFQNAPAGELNCKGLNVSPMRMAGETAKFDLTLSVHEGGPGLRAGLQYSTDLFDEATIDRMLDHFETLLEGIVANPEQRISDLPILTAAEKHQLLAEWKDPQKDYPQDKCLHELFEAQVEKTPDALAVIFEDQQLTYRHLNARANQLAYHLRKLGVGPDVPVGLCVERSLAMLVALMGILKAGGAYVPLDPEYPKDRLALMLADSRAATIVTEQRFADRFPQVQAILMCLDDESANSTHETIENPATNVTPQNLAYVVYTSGSTGTPKAVMIEHRSVVNYLYWFNHAVPADKLQILPAITRLTFDASLKQLFAPLLRAGQVWIVPEEVISDPAALVRALATRSLTGLNCVPTLWNALLDLVESGQPSLPRETLSVLLLGGEQLNKSLTDRTFAIFPGIEIWNLYGPTEATANALAGRITCDEPIRLGKPIANAAIALLDANLEPVPLGVTGELYIAGVGLARGYLGRADLTAEKFIPNPFSAELGARLYKTGDLARYLPDGNIEFLGRIDHQLKIRGFRIELGEIETVLRSHPAVQQAVVTARQDVARDDKLLVAYVVGSQPGSCTAAELHGYVKMKLPSYMLPAAFVFLDALPLTASGKVNLQALPPPDGNRMDGTETFVAPRNPIESQMAGIWSKLLGLERIGVRDNFFDLGGHSLLGVRLFAEIEKAFDKRPALASLFEEPTIEHLAKLISHETPETMSPSLIAIRPHGSRLPFFCVHEFFGDVFCYRNLARHMGEDQPFYALQPRGLDGVEEPLETVEAMAAYYIDTVRTVQPRGPYVLGGLCFGGVIAFEMAQQLRAKGESVRFVALLDSGIRLNYSRIRWWGRFFYNFPRDFHSWLLGSLQLTGSQWLDVIRIKTAAAKGRLGGLFRLPAGVCQADDDLAGLKRLGDVFHFSERHHRVARAQYRALKSYQPQMYTGRLTLFRARMQPFFSSHDPNKGWSRVAAGGVEVKSIPGNHLGMLQEPHVHVLAKELSACLEKASREA